jgi:hypothetical protein
MSVINQMLNQLEQRGVHTAEQNMVRAVPHTARNFTTPCNSEYFNQGSAELLAPRGCRKFPKL